MKEQAELEAFENERRSQIVPLHRRVLEITNTNLDGIRVGKIRECTSGVAVSRLKSSSSDEIHLATDDAVVHMGDVLLAVGTEVALDSFQRIVGKVSNVDLMQTPARMEFRHLLVTRKEVLGKSLRQLALGTLCGVVVTRVQRAGWRSRLERTSGSSLAIACMLSATPKDWTKPQPSWGTRPRS